MAVSYTHLDVYKRQAVSYARQLPEKDSGEIERFTRAYNYPEESCVKGKEQLPEMGIKKMCIRDRYWGV